MILCLEGINGAGKSSFAGIVERVWRETTGGHARRVDPVQHTAFGRGVRKAIMDSQWVDADAEALAFAAARLDGITALRAQATEPATLLVLERWAGAVAAYGRAEHGESGLVDLLETLLWERGGFPCILIDTPGGIAQGRLDNLTQRNKFETRGSSYLDAVGAHYREWASRRRVTVVDGTASEQDLLRNARHLLTATEVVR